MKGSGFARAAILGLGSLLFAGGQYKAERTVKLIQEKKSGRLRTRSKGGKMPHSTGHKHMAYVRAARKVHNRRKHEGR